MPEGTHPCVLTEAFDEADDTSPAPFSWHFHGVNSHTEKQRGVEVGKMTKKVAREEECDTGRRYKVKKDSLDSLQDGKHGSQA